MADKKKQNDYSAYQEYVNKRNNITPEQYMEYAVNRQGIGQRMAEKRVNNLNNILSNDYLANLGNGQYKTPLQTYQTKRMARDAWLAYDSAAEYLRAVYGRDAASDLDSYARYIKQLNDAAKSEASFYGQFAGQQDYNERYAYPQTVKGKTDAEIEAMMAGTGDAAYLAWLNNNTLPGIDKQINATLGRKQANLDAQEKVNSRVYTAQTTPETNAAKVAVDYWSNLKPTDSMIRADRADQVKYNTQQRLYDVYIKAMTGAAMTDDEQLLFNAYVANSPAWQEKQTQLDGNISDQEAQQKRMADSKHLLNAYNEQKDTTYADFVGILRDNNSPLMYNLNKAGEELQAANAALDSFDAKHDAYVDGLTEVENTADMSKVWADIDYADSNQAEYNELVSDRDQKKKAFDAAVAAIENAYSGYIDNAMTGAERSAVDVLDASNILGELQNQQLSLVDDQYAAAMPSVPQAVGQTRVDAFEQERLANLERALRNEDYAKLLAAKEWEENLYSDRNALNAEALDLEYEEVLLKVKREEVAAGSKYNELSKAPDFKTLSTYDSSIEDDLYNYLNTKGTSQETGKKLMLGMENYGYDADEIRDSVYSDYGYTFLLPEEVQAYNYIYKKEGREKAQEFLDSFQNIRNLRARSKESEEWKKYAEETGAWSSVVSWGTKFASGMMYPVQLADAVFNPDHSQFSSLYSTNYATQAIRGVRGEVWDKKAKEWFGGKDDEYPKFMGENLGSAAYNLFMGLGDMTLAHGAGKLAATLGNINFAKGVTEFVVGSQVGSDVLLQNLHNGVPKDRAIAMAVAASVVESLTERFSIDAIWKDPDNAAKFIAKNIATEASEESASTFANTIVDLIVNANHAELSKAIAKDGYEKAMNAYLQSVGLDAIMGGLTGAIMSGGKVAAGKTVETAHTISTGKQINTNQTYKQLHDIAVAMPEGSKARKIAQGKDKLNNRKAGQLYNALMEELDAKSQTSVRKSMVTDIKGRLQELGAQGDTTQVAEAIQKAWMGEKLSARESDLIAQSKLAMQVQHELLDLEEGWAEKAHETASKQRRETLTQMLDVERLASKGYKPAQDDAAAKAISKNASTTYANADQKQGLNTKAYTKEGTTVEIKRIEEQDGKAVYLVEKDGQDVTYAINDLELDSVNTENLVQPLKQGKMSVQAANTMMQLYATSGLSAPLYAKGFMVAYNAGVQRIGMAYVNNNSYSKALSPEVRKAAFDAGMADTKDEAPTVTKRKGRVTMDKSIDKANLTDGQKASIRAMEKLAKALHIDIEFFASKADATGSYAAYENGSFRDGVMRLDINAGRDKSTDVTEFAILRTASHELTHYIAEASPQMYRELQAFVVDHLLEKGESLQTLMDRKKARENRAMSDEAALEEVIADACEMMLKDSTAIETLARENATLFEKMADWLRDFFDKIREAFAGVEAVHDEARALMEADADGVMHYIDGLQALWDRALVDAAHNVSAVADVGAVYDASTESAAPTMYSLRTWNESEYMANKKKAAEELSTALGVSKSKAMRWIDDINGIAKMVADNKELLDYEANEFTSAIKSNAEYGGSVDFSTICAKRRLATGTLDAIQRALRNSVLTQDDIFRIRNMMLDKGYEVACGLCYVESARKDFGRYAKAFLDEYKQTNPAWIPDMADVNTVDGLDDMRREHPEAYAAYEKYMNKLAQRKPKLYEKRTEYRNEILKKFKGDDTVSKKNLAGGFRIQSFSDFEIVHLLDMMQVIMDMSHVGLAGQAYTKVPDFAWALGDTGLKINLSMIAKGVKNGKIVFDEREGMKVAEAKALRDRYSKNVGTILVVFSDAQLKAALNDDFIDFIIPFHRSQWSKKNYGALGLPTDTRDFTSQQNERYLKPHYNERGKRIRPVNYSPNAYWDYSKSGKENAETYLRMCAEDGRRPKFAKLLVDNGDGSYSLQVDGSTDGYWKLLIDFKMYDNAGNGSPQLPVQPSFNMDEARRMLNEYKGGHAAYPVAQDIVDEFVSEYRGEKFSRRGGDLLTAQEAKRLASNWNDYKYRGYQFTKRPNGGIVVVMDKTMVYTDKKGKPEYVLDIYDDDIWRINEIQQYMMAMEEEGYDHEMQRIVLESSYGTSRARFRSSGERFGATREDGKGTGRDAREMGDGDFGEVSENEVKLQARDADTISSRDILANARPEDYRQSAAHGFLVDYQKAYQELERLADKLDKYQKAASAGNLDRDEQIKADNRVNLVRDQVLRQENKLHKMESKPEFTKVLAQEREAFYNAVNSMTADELNAKIKQLEAKYKTIETASAKELEDLELALEMNLGKKAAKELRVANDRNEKLKTENKALRNEVNLTGKKIDFAVAEKELAMEMSLGHKREIMRQMYERRIATLKSKNAQKLAAANQRGRERLEKYRERVKDTQSRAALRDRIRHDVKTLNRLLLNETDVKHVPEELKGAVAQFLTVFTQDTSVFDQKKLDDLRYAYGKISDKNAANEDLPDISAQYDWDIANMMDDLREILPGRRLSELTQEETRKIRDIVQHFKFIVKESSRLFFFDKSRDIASAGQRFIEDTDQQKKYNGPDGAVANMLRGGMITPSYFFKKLGGVAKELFDDLKQGESTYGLRVAQARKFFDDVAEKYHYDDWRNVKDDVLTLNTQQGHEVVLTREQALGLYATWNRENSENGQNASHLSEGGFVYEEAMKKDKKTGKIEVDTSKPHKMTDKDMQQVANWLTDEQRAYADAMVEYMSKDMAKLGNEVSMKLFGIEKYGEEKYYPYQTSKNYRYTALGAAAATNDQRLKHSSFTHRVTQFANNPIIAADFTTVWANHVNHMLLYSSMCVPLENFNRVYNYKYADEDGNHSVKQSLINAYGSSAQKYIEQLMHDLNGGVAVQSDGVMDQLTSKFKKNAVYASASVVVQQPSAMVRAMALVNPKYFASGVMKDGSWDELTRYSGVAVIKEMGGFDTSTGFGAQDWITGERRKTKLETFSKKADDIASFLPERADRLAWVAIWKAVKAEVADNTGLEGEELLQAAAKRFDEVIGYTQVYDSTLSKSQMMRNKHLNAVTAFMAEPTVTYNLLVDAFTNRGKADSVNPARAVAAFTATAIVNAMLKSLVTAARDDEEKNYLEKYAGEFVENVTSDLNPLNLIPYARDIVSIMQGYDVERADMSLISDLYKGVKRGIESAKDGDWYTMAKEFAGPISGLVGLPVKNVWRDIEAVFNTIHSIGTPMTPGGMKYSILEALPFYGSTPTDYYSRRLDAMLEGDASELESLTMHLETGMGKAAKTVKSKTKEELGKRYKAGKIGDAEATDILMDYFEMDADEAYWQLKEWREKEAHKDEEDYSFSHTDDLEEALLGGKTAQIEAAKKELAAGGYTDKEVVSKAKSAIKSLYVDGQITLDKAMKLLQDQAGDMTKDDLYWTEQEWAYEKANPDGEWNKFMGAHAAIESGKGAKQAAKELLTHGVEKGDAARAIATRWKTTYVSLYNTDRKAALDLHSRILDMYVALGYSRSYQIKYIKDHWFE